MSVSELKIEKLIESPKELKLKVDGIGHTLCNILQKTMLDEENVEFAGYDIPHPLGSSSIIYIRTNGKIKPEKVLLNAIKTVRSLTEDFKKSFLEAFNK